MTGSRRDTAAAVRKYADLQVEVSLHLPIYRYATSMNGLADQEDLRLRFDVLTRRLLTGLGLAAEPPPGPLVSAVCPPDRSPTLSSPSVRRRFAGGSGAPCAGLGHLAGPAADALSCGRTDRECQPEGPTGDGARRRGARNVARSS